MESSEARSINELANQLVDSLYKEEEKSHQKPDKGHEYPALTINRYLSVKERSLLGRMIRGEGFPRKFSHSDTELEIRDLVISVMKERLRPPLKEDNVKVLIIINNTMLSVSLRIT